MPPSEGHSSKTVEQEPMKPVGRTRKLLYYIKEQMVGESREEIEDKVIAAFSCGQQSDFSMFVSIIMQPMGMIMLQMMNETRETLESSAVD
jgi:hypothetical protein